MEQEALGKSIQHIQVECPDVPVLRSALLEPGTTTMTTTTTMSASMPIFTPIGMPALVMMTTATATAMAAPITAVTAASTTMMVSKLGIAIPFTAWTIAAISVMGCEDIHHGEFQQCHEPAGNSSSTQVYAGP